MDKDKDILGRVKGYFEQAVGNAAWQRWQAEAREAFDFYDGDQWSSDEKAKLADVGQAPIVINKIASKVDNIAGTEVAGRTRILYQSRSGVANEAETARVLSDLALYVAERNDQAVELSHVFRDGLVSGIGWLDVGVEDSDEGALIFNRAEDPFSVVWDPMSRRADMSDMRFVCRERWLSSHDMETMFGEAGMAAFGKGKAGVPLGGSAAWAMRGAGGESINYYDGAREVMRVVEVQYLEPTTVWRVRLPSGAIQLCTDKKDVKRFTALHKGAEVDDASELMRARVAYFAGDVLLSDEALPYWHGGFTLIPYVYKRHKKDGRPYGLVRAAVHPQRELNKRRSKAMHLLNTAQVIADIDAVDDPNVLAREAARPDGMILKRAGKDLRIIRNTDLAVSQVQIMENAGRDIQDVMGVFDEALGRETNAVSGIAIQQRQMATSLNQMFAFDALRRTKKRLGEQILALMKQHFTHEMAVRITDTFGAGTMIGLNQPLRDDMGREVLGEDGQSLVQNDPRVGAFDVVVEEVADVASAREREAQQLKLLIDAGVPVPPEVLVEMSGVRHKREIAAHLSRTVGE
ncbi:MAG: hypothetical protein COY40_04595 [Alphaproteobacteria bacterium CG_4_10_14_0_8_um_filter_53_9]|nr:MAG: hypothetical protein COY40_04595 [Alphaproteobacteria bacterium CG_4_10_14_0_8_um_filter_53_9]